MFDPWAALHAAIQMYAQNYKIKGSRKIIEK